MFRIPGVDLDSGPAITVREHIVMRATTMTHHLYIPVGRYLSTRSIGTSSITSTGGLSSSTTRSLVLGTTASLAALNVRTSGT